MKKAASIVILCIILNIFLIVEPPAARAQNVYHPDSETVWYSGQTDTYVSWDSEIFRPGYKVYIQLLKDSDDGIGKDIIGWYCYLTDNDGMYSRIEPIPSSWGSGNNFIISIADTSESDTLWSEEFTLLPPSPTPEGYKTPIPTLSITPSPSITPTPTIHIVNIDSGDYNGDGTSDVAIFRSNSGLWGVRGITRAYFGTINDQPVSGDYNGDGTSDIGIFRGSSGLWAIRGVTRAYFGSSSDLAIPLAFNPSSACNIGIFRDSTGLWAIRGVTRIYFGASGDKPIPGDYDGDATKDIAIFRGSSGLWAIQGVSRIYYGSDNSMVVPGDYNGSGNWAPGIFRKSSGLWAIRGVTRSYFGDA